MNRDVACPCTQGICDLLIAAKPDSDLLKRIECAGCGKIVWVNRETEYCFVCEAKLAREKKE